MKQCTACKEIEPLGEFHVNNSNKDGLATRCKGCTRAAAKKHYQSNRDRLIESSKQYQRDNRDRVYEGARRWRLANKDRSAEWRRRYREGNAEKERVYTQRRKARKAALPATLTTNEWDWLVSMTQGCCIYCGAEADNLAQEHVIPLIQNGGYTIENIRPSCRACNSRKGGRTPEQAGMELIEEYEEAIQKELSFKQGSLF